MDLKLVDLNLLGAFEALMTAQSVSGAAARLGISQPAMSGTLMRLRALFADELFVRSGRAMLPTVRAIQIDGQIAPALAQIRAALEPPSPFDPENARRVFAVSGGDYATMVILPRLTAHLAEAAPLIDLRFRFVEKDAIIDQLDADTLDLALGVFPDPPKRFCLQPLFEERFVCIARHGHPALNEGLTLETFVDLRHLLVTERGDESGAIDQALAKLGRERHVKLTVPHVLVVPTVLAGGELIASVGARAARLFARSAPIASYELPVSLPSWSLSMLWARRKTGDLGLSWLRAVLTEIGSQL